jgi:hypothetical protein
MEIQWEFKLSSEEDDALVTLLKVQRSSCRELYWTPLGIQSVNLTMMLW